MKSQAADVFYTTLGILGAFLCLYGYLGLSNEPKIYCYLIGSITLLATAIYYKLIYFIALELILIAGHLAGLFGSGPYTQASLPILLCLQLVIIYAMIEQSNLLFLIIGTLGIALLSIGFSLNNNLIFFFGGLFIALYAYYEAHKGHKAAYLWAILNTIFAILALWLFVQQFL